MLANVVREKGPLRLTGVRNFRDLGGLSAHDGRRVRPGLLMRSGHLGSATDTDLRRLAGLGLRTVVDFRVDGDLAADGLGRVPPGAARISLPLPDRAARSTELRDMVARRDRVGLEKLLGNGGARAFARRGVERLATDPEATRCFARFLELVAGDGRRPLLFHCSAGKDRAGWAATVVLLALGARDDVIVDHYLASNAPHLVREMLESAEGMGFDPELVRPLVVVDAEYLRTGLDALESHWGGRQRYLERGLGFGSEQERALRESLLE